MSQTSYVNSMEVASAGLIEGLNPTVKRSWQNPSDIMRFGHFAAKESSANDAIQNPALIGDDIRGVVMRSLAQVDGNFPALSSIALLEKGEIWVEAEEAVVPSDTPHIRYSGKKQVQTITLDGDLITANVITTTVNGNAVATTFVTDHDTTMTAHAVLIAALANVTSAVAAVRVITVTSDQDATLVITSVVTLGASQAGIVIAESIAAILNAERGKLRNDTDSTTALDASGYVKILDYNATAGLALVRVDVL